MTPCVTAGSPDRLRGEKGRRRAGFGRIMPAMADLDLVAIVTGGGRGLGRAMAFGLARAGARVIAAAHIAEDLAALDAETRGSALAERLVPVRADLRRPADCDGVVAAAVARFGSVDALVNNAGLTFTYITPDKFRRPDTARFYEASDAIIQNVMDTNYVAADQMARRVAPGMVARGWGRIINVTTMLETMHRAGSAPYGPSKAALEMASEIWSKDLADTGVTVNVLNPGGGANTPGMAEERRAASRTGAMSKLVEPDEMVAPLVWLVSRATDRLTGWRFDANRWDPAVSPEDNVKRAGRPAGFVLREPPAAGREGDP
jgi:3-oxoacyl-[acyl-carrier protein] reductase